MVRFKKSVLVGKTGPILKKMSYSWKNVSPLKNVSQLEKLVALKKYVTVAKMGQT